MPGLLLATRRGRGGDWRGERREEGRRGQGLFAAPSRPPPQAAAGASCVVTMQIAAIAEINKGIGRGERAANRLQLLQSLVHSKAHQAKPERI